LLLRTTIVAALILGNCADRRYGDDAPSLSFQGPLPALTLSAAQIKLVQNGIAPSLTDPASASFGRSYRAGTTGFENEIVVCGFVNGKRFVGMFAKPEDGPVEFLPIRIAIEEMEQEGVREYCRANGIYVPK
jgi:hypothetical protein